jgi:phosphoglycerate dehydrogenase-like enzyme
VTPFRALYTGDYLNGDGEPVIPDLAFDHYHGSNVAPEFLRDQAPPKGDPLYWDRLYSLEVAPRHVAAADAIVIFRPWMKASAFAQGAERLVVIGRAGAGVDKIDLAACTANDVAVFNAPGTLTHATASSAFLLMLALAKRLPEQERLVRDGRWDLQPQTMGADLPGKTLGIVGLGASGRELARLARPWGMRVFAFSPRADAAVAASLDVTLVDSLDELFGASDFVSLHNRLEPATRGLVRERHFQSMKPTAYFINVARGELVEEAALIRALANRAIAGAGLDVFEHEPLPLGSPLLSLPNVILTPHWLPSTRDAARLTMATMAEGVLRAAAGCVPDNVVNLAVLEREGFRAKLARFAPCA